MGKDYLKTWLETGYAPMPNIYEVLHFSWIRETQADKWDKKHYLLSGEWVYIEVLAEKWTWKITEES